MTADKKNVITVLRALELLSKELGTDVPLTYPRALLHVWHAGDAGLDQGELAKMLDVSPPATVRAVQALGKFSWIKDSDTGNKKPGLDLIHSEQNSNNFRLRTLTLTAAGKRLIEMVGGAR